MNKQKKNKLIMISFCTVAGVIFFLFMPLLFKTYIAQAFKMPSGSMKPTLLVGDYFLTDKTYASTKKVERGDILIFEYPRDHRKIYIKRAIGLPGETLEIKNKKVYINEELIKETYVIHTHNRIFDANENPRDNLGPIVVPENSYFMMGDNRDESNDSRFWGFLNSSNIKGKAGVIYWSWDNTNFRVRWNRIGKPVE